MKNIELYICSSDALAWCAILVYGDKYKMLHGIKDSGTRNMETELTALLNALQALKEPCNIKVLCRNVTLINCGSGAWKRKSFKELWEPIQNEIVKHQIEWIRTYESQALPYDNYAHNMARKVKREYLEKNSRVDFTKEIGTHQQELF